MPPSGTPAWRLLLVRHSGASLRTHQRLLTNPKISLARGKETCAIKLNIIGHIIDLCCQHEGFMYLILRNICRTRVSLGVLLVRAKHQFSAFSQVLLAVGQNKAMNERKPIDLAHNLHECEAFTSVSCGFHSMHSMVLKWFIF